MKKMMFFSAEKSTSSEVVNKRERMSLRMIMGCKLLNEEGKVKGLE